MLISVLFEFSELKELFNKGMHKSLLFNIQILKMKLSDLLTEYFQGIAITAGGCGVFAAYAARELRKRGYKVKVMVFSSAFAHFAKEDFLYLVKNNAPMTEVNKNGFYFSHLVVYLPEIEVYIDGKGVYREKCFMCSKYECVEIPLRYAFFIVKDKGNWNTLFSHEWEKNVPFVKTAVKAIFNRPLTFS